ncbi:MAG: hypothetical protein IKS43_06065 [Clostridia bacterium]|nr:hypothetical protein [Clostridia bacterium]
MKKIVPVLMTVLFGLLLLPPVLYAGGLSARALPENVSFCPQEVKCLFEFFEQADSYGVKNGAKLMGADYESIKADPSLWLFALPAGSLNTAADDGGVMHFTHISFTDKGLCGGLNLNEFGSLRTVDLSQNGIERLSAVNCPLAESIMFASNGSHAAECSIAGLPSLKTVDCSGSSCRLSIVGSPAMELVKCGGGVKSAVLSDCGLAVFDASGNMSISQISIAGSGTESLLVSGCASLDTLDCRACALEELDLTGCTALKLLDCASNALESLDLSGLSALRVLNCSGNSLVSLMLYGCSLLESADCSGNSGLTAVTGLASPALTTADFSYTPIRQLDFTGMTGLQTLSVAGCGSLERLLAPKSGLSSLDCTGLSSLSELDLNHCSELMTVSASGTALKRADLSGVEQADLVVLAEGDGVFWLSHQREGGSAVYARPAESAALLGWYGADGSPVTEDAVCPIRGNEGGSLTAVFGSAYHTVTFTDGFNGETVAVMTVLHGDPLIPPELPVHEGLACSGWQEDGRPADFSRITRDMYVTADYTAAQCNVVFIDGITMQPFASLLAEYGSAVIPPEPPVHSGWHFTGWDRELDCVTEDMVVYAGYEADYGVSKPGDVNCDGSVTASDISVLFAYVMNSASLSDEALNNADINGDGAADATDASLLAQSVFGAKQSGRNALWDNGRSRSAL